MYGHSGHLVHVTRTFGSPILINLSVIGPVVSEENMFENVDGRRTDGRRTPESSVYY